MPARRRWLATALPALLLAGPACGKKGDPQAPLRRTPQGPAEFEVGQRGERVLVSLRAPRAWSDGARLPVVELELLRAEGPGDFTKLARARRLRAAPGEALTESEPAPAPGTRLRFAVRTRADGKLSALSRVVALEVQAPPPPPGSLSAARADGRVRLAWTPPASLVPAPTAPPVETPPPSPLPSGPPVEATPPSSVASTPPGEAAGPPTVPTPSPAEVPRPSPPPTPAPPGFWVYRRAAEGVFGEPLAKTPVAGPGFEDEAPLREAACYVVRTVVSSDPVIESADSNEACVPAATREPSPTPSAGVP